MHFTRLFWSEATFCAISAAPNSLEGFQTHQWKLHLYLTVFAVLRIRNSHHGSLNLSHPFFHWLELRPDIWAYYSAAIQKCHTGSP